jgi:hypothetical protein
MEIQTAYNILLGFGFTGKQLEIMTRSEIIAIACRLRDKYGCA